MRDSWDPNDPENSYRLGGAWEFRYDGSGRQRYLARYRLTPLVDPNDPNSASDLEPSHWAVDPCMPTYWTDYLGEMPFGDYTMVPGTSTATDTRRYLPALGIEAQENIGSDWPVHLRRDMLDSTLMITGPTGDPNTFTVGQSTFATVAYTAFGELVWAADPNGETWTLGNNPPAGFPRYAYDGGWGYESFIEGSDPSAFGSPGGLTLRGPSPELPPVNFEHVGARWYQPSTGRFLQRDRIGIRGGLNVYLYCKAGPLSSVDPFGSIHLSPWQKGVGVALVAAAAIISVPFVPAAMLPMLVMTEVGTCIWGADELDALGQEIVDFLLDSGSPLLDAPEDPPGPPGPGGVSSDDCRGGCHHG